MRLPVGGSCSHARIGGCWLLSWWLDKSDEEGSKWLDEVSVLSTGPKNHLFHVVFVMQLARVS